MVLFCQFETGSQPLSETPMATLVVPQPDPAKVSVAPDGPRAEVGLTRVNVPGLCGVAVGVASSRWPAAPCTAGAPSGEPPGNIPIASPSSSSAIVASASANASV